MKKYAVVLIILLISLINTGCEDEPGLKEEDLTDFNKLIWIKGIWEGRQGDAKLYESWRSVNYRTLEGFSYTSVKGKRVYVQTMRIEQSNNRILLSIKYNEGSDETLLELSEANEEEVVFVNSEGVYPEKVTYQKKGNKMLVQISGSENSNSKKQEFVYRKTQEG